MAKNSYTLYCPQCGQELRIKNWDRDSIAYYSKTKCKECEIVIYIEDRSSYEQEGTITITFC